MEITTENLNALIAEKNRQFALLSPEEKRVTIARDVINEIKTGRFVAETGDYVGGLGDSRVTEEEGNGELALIFAKLDKCNVCAVGGLFFCAVERADELKLRPHHQGAGRLVDKAPYDSAYLRRFFDEVQLDVIEQWFECWLDSRTGMFSQRGPHERMQLIMENIVANNGTFVPEKMTDHPGYAPVAAETEVQP